MIQFNSMDEMYLYKWATLRLKIALFWSRWIINVLGRRLCEKWKPPDQIPSLQGVSMYVRYTVMQRVQHRVEQLSGGCNSSLRTSLRSLPVERCKTDNICVLL